jgi:hypothetical protein
VRSHSFPSGTESYNYKGFFRIVVQRRRSCECRSPLCVVSSLARGANDLGALQWQTSAFVPGTKMYNYVQGKDVIYLGQNDVDLVNKAVVDLNKILGFNP